MISAEKDIDLEALLAKAKAPEAESLRLHRFYRGKVETALKCPVRNLDDFALWYTPGVAEPCRAIAAEPDQVYELTNKWNTVAIVSDGSRVLGLGNIGPKAGLPVMEGKALLYKYLGGVDAVPLMLDTNDPAKLIETVLMLQPSFGGINLEDIAQPKCFDILDALHEKAEIPVWHDDQQGTATVTLAALMNALQVVGKKAEDVSIAFIGAGASNVAIARLIFAWGVDPAYCYMADRKGILGMHREDIYRQRESYADKWHYCNITNIEGRQGGVAEAIEGVDVVIALSHSGPGIIQPQWVERMNHDAIVFACANPIPEIWPWEARQAGARIVATGRSDFPNQVNNSLGFPGIFRGALDVRAHTITDEMCFAAAEALAQHIGHRLDDEHILPGMDDWELFAREAAAVGMKAQEQNVAALQRSYDQLYSQAVTMISRSQEMTEMLMHDEFIASAS
jgi:malate dehydrogenase (oxaloacetate-decarboxylating)